MFKPSVLFPLLLACCARANAAEPTTYQISSERSEIYAFAGPDVRAPFWVFTDRHVVRAKQIEGTVGADPDDTTSCEIDLSIPSNQLEIDPPDLRDQLGWEPIRAEDRASIRHAIEGESMLEVEKYPTITLRSERCEWLEEGQIELGAVLTLHGIDQLVRVPLSVSFERGTLEATGTFEIRHEDFAMQPYANARGTIKIARTITIVVRVVGVRSSQDPLQS